jgi:hypothetical protein
MADTKLDDIASGAPAAATDIIYAVKDPAGTPADAKLTLGEVIDLIEASANTFTSNQVIIVTDNTNAALRVTQLGTGPVILVEDEANPDASPFIVLADGSIGVGTTSPTARFDMVTIGGGATFQNRGEGVTQNISARFTTNAIGPQVVLQKNRGTIASPSAVASADQLGVLRFQGYGGTNYRNIAEIVGTVDTYTSDTDISTYLAFFTSAAGGTSLTERLRIGQNGVMTSQASYDNTVSGSALQVTSAGVIGRTSSSIKYKTDVEDLDPALTDHAIAKLRPVWYRSKDANGDDKAEWSHIGLIAEEVDQVEKRLVRYRTVDVSYIEEPVLDGDGNPVLDESGQLEIVSYRVETELEQPAPEDVDYARLSVLLLDKVKRLEARIAALEVAQ